MQPREWIMLALLILIPLAIAAVVTLWSIKQMAYTPKKPARPKPVLTADEAAALRPETPAAPQIATGRENHDRPPGGGAPGDPAAPR